MSAPLTGTIRGNVIQLDQPSGLADGERVQVLVQPCVPNGAPGEGIRQSAGAWADAGAELDQWLDQVYRARNNDCGRLSP